MYDDFLTGYEVYGDVEPGYEDEQWSKLDEFDGEHYISSVGRVCSYYVRRYRFVGTSRLIKGYPTVTLCKNGIKCNKQIHRLVAEHFIPNPDDLPMIRHLNDIKTDNRVENLAWGTQSDNMKDRNKNGGIKNHQIPVILIDCQTGEGIYFYDCREASRYLGVCHSSVWAALMKNGTIKAHRVIRASNVNLPDSIKNGEHLKENFGKSAFQVKNYKVKAYNINTGEEIVFENSTEAGKYFEKSNSTISNYINQRRKISIMNKTWELSRIFKEDIYGHTEN